MIQNLLQNNTVPMLEQVVNFSQARHNLLAGNIANLDTPGYRGKDLDTQQFTKQLQAQVEAQKLGLPSAVRGARALRSGLPSGPFGTPG